MEAVNNKLPTV